MKTGCYICGMKNETYYKEGQEYLFKVRTKQEFNELIGELTITHPDYPIEGYLSMFDDVDNTIIEGIEISLRSLWKYREFITSFSIGSEDIPTIIFWIHLEN